jgi:HPr kinase/phosphorylase
MSAIKEDKEVDLVVKLEPWNENTFYDRLGTNEEFTTILDMKVPVITIPVKPGRNLAVIVEVAAMNNRQKRMGFNAAKEFARQLDEHFEEMMMQSQMETAEDYDEYDDLSYEED